MLKSLLTPFFSATRSKWQDRRSFDYGNLEPRQLLATITWSSGAISNAADVSTNGTLVFAISGSANSGQSEIVNGVNFIASNRDNATAEAQAQSPGDETISTTLGNNSSTAFTNGGFSGSLGEIIRGGWWGTTSGTTASVTLSGLTIGQSYEIQLFANDARDIADDGFISRLDDGNGGQGVDLNLNNQPNGDNPGDFGIGTFTADGPTQSFNISGFRDGNPNAGRVQVNAIQLRSVNLLPGAVPLINEFSASNRSVIDDDNGNSSDWIEIYNAGEDSLNLAGYSLTDDPTDPTKFVFPSTTLDGGRYLVVFAADDSDPSQGTDIYTGFGLSAGGEYLGLFDSAGNLVSEFGTSDTNYPAQFTDISYGLVNDGNFNNISFFATPTPGAGNVDPVDGVIDSFPAVSVERGFYDTAFDVDIVSQEPGVTLVYTTDGSQPTLTNGIQVPAANPSDLAQITLNIAETTSLRTGSFLPNVLTQGTTTHSYIFLDDVLEQSLINSDVTDQYSQEILREALLDLPTVSFNFDDEIGRFDPEQRTSFEFLAPDGGDGFQVDAGIEPFGGNATNFAKRNFRLNFRSEYGTSKLEFPLFEGFDDGVTPATTIFDTLDLRAGSHDRAQRGFGLSNRFADQTLLDAGHVAAHGRFVHLYLNGEYWGQYHLREHVDDDFAASYFGGDNEDYEAILGNIHDGPGGFGLGRVGDGSGVAWANVTSIVNDTSLSPSERFAALSQTVDLEQYIDFVLIFAVGASEPEFDAVGASDGSVPFIFHFNDADGLLRDPLDGTNGNNPNISGDKTGNPGPLGILGQLIEDGDPEFLSFYADRIQNLFLNDGALSVAQSTARLQALVDQVELSVILEEARWGNSLSTSDPAGGSLSVAEFQARAQDALDRILPEIVEGDNNVIERLRDRGVFPGLDAPEILVDGSPQYFGDISDNAELTFAANSTVYYTLDGSDPRLPGGDLNPNAIAYDVTATQTALVESGDQWRLYDAADGLDGVNWQSPTFDDSAWETGFTQLGFGDDQNPGVDNNGQITTYFRHTFDVADASAVSEFTLRLQRDDGAVVYLNGVEIARDNLPQGTVTSSTLASGAIGGSAEDTFLENDDFDFFSFASSLLVTGSNTLAVEIHQVSANSTDVTFDAEILVTTATQGSPPIPLNNTTQVNSRTFVNGEFSALSTADLTLPASPFDLRISEINFNPADPNVSESSAGFTDNDDFEFIEIFNPNTIGSVNLEGIQFSAGIEFTFGAYDLLPGERVVIVEDLDAFAERYGDDVTVLGEWSGGLSNSGETLTLVDSDLSEIMSVDYGDGNGDQWYIPTDGNGYTLVLNDPASTPASELDQFFSWRPSAELGGTPGGVSAPQTGTAPTVAVALINEGSAQRSSISQLTITLDGDVEVDANAITLIQRSDADGKTTGTVVATSHVCGLDDNGNTILIVTFESLTRNDSGVLEDGNYQLTIDHTKVRRAGTSITMEQDFVFGDTAVDNFYSLFGDNNGDRTINVVDLLALRQTYLRSTADSGYNPAMDFDGNGTVNVIDLLSFRRRFLTTLPFA